MRQGDPNLTTVGKQIAVGPRTLQAGLKRYGFELDKARWSIDTRRVFASTTCGTPNLTLAEIAYLPATRSQRLQPRLPTVDGLDAVGDYRRQWPPV